MTDDDFPDDFLDKKNPLEEYLRNKGPYPFPRRREPSGTGPENYLLIPSIHIPEGEPLLEHCPRCDTEFIFDIQASDPPAVTTQCSCGRWRFELRE